MRLGCSQKSQVDTLELYNLAADPTEQTPLPKNHPMYNRLFAALRDHICKAGAVPWQKYPVNLDEPLSP